MLQIGNYNRLKVKRQVDFGMYLDSDQGDILIPNKYIPEGTKIDDMLQVFVYTDSEDRLIATTLQPYGVVGEFAAMEVKQVNRFGAFLDWGLEKDLLLPHKEQHRQVQEGQKVVVRVCLDHKTNRVIAVAKLNPFFDRDLSLLEEGQKVRLLAYDVTDLGYQVVINDTFTGIVYKNEVFEPLRIGDSKEGFIKKIREDNKADVSLRQQGFSAVSDAKSVVLEALQEAGGFLPYHDASSPEEIKKAFKMSKKSFKKAIGGLYKEGKIKIEVDGIKLF